MNGMIIPSFIFSNRINDDSKPPKAKAPLSHINIFAGLILYHKKENNTATTITIKEVAIYVELRKVTTDNVASIIDIIPAARPSNQSVILIA